MLNVWHISLLQTDTASVLLEAIGYIRFLQSQIEVMFLLLHEQVMECCTLLKPNGPFHTERLDLYTFFTPKYTLKSK